MLRNSRLGPALVVIGIVVMAAVSPATAGSGPSPGPSALQAEDGDLARVAYTVRRFLGPGEFEYSVATVNPDGSDTQLIDTRYYDYAGFWSPDHTRIAFLSGAEKFVRLFVANADGSDRVRVNTTEGSRPTRLAVLGFDWSPDGTQLVYSDSRRLPSGVRERFTAVVDLSTNERTELLQGSEVAISPRWSPDGSSIAFLRHHDGRWDVFTMRADGTDLAQLTRSRRGVQNTDPQWSPDGTQLLFSRRVMDVPFDLDLWVMGSDGSSKSLLASSKAMEYWGRWSPDGTRIAYGRIGNRSGLAHIWLINPDGSDTTRLTTEGEGGFAGFDWSPSGSEIVTTSQSMAGNTSERDLFRIEIATQLATRITNTVDDDEQSPDW